MSTLPFDDETVRDALRSVDDPEAGMNIVDLGLIYEIEVVPGKVTVEMTMTTQACPMTEMIMAQARAAIEGVAAPGTEIDLRLVWDPPWTPDKMSGMAREFFGWKL